MVNSVRSTTSFLACDCEAVKTSTISSRGSLNLSNVSFERQYALLYIYFFCLILDEVRQDPEKEAKQFVGHNGAEDDQSSQDVHNPSKESGQFDDPSTEGQDVDLVKVEIPQGRHVRGCHVRGHGLGQNTLYQRQCQMFHVNRAQQNLLHPNSFVNNRQYSPLNLTSTSPSSAFVPVRRGGSVASSASSFSYGDTSYTESLTPHHPLIKVDLCQVLLCLLRQHLSMKTFSWIRTCSILHWGMGTVQKNSNKQTMN